MRTIPSLIAVLFAATAVLGQPNTQTTERLATGKPVTIVCFGDSITGVYYHTGGRRAYPEMLEIAIRKTFPEAKVKVINAGISGNTTRQALARIERDVLTHKPALVTVMFGMNDLVGVPIEEFKKNMIEIKDRCRKAGAEVLFCTQNNVIENARRPNKKLAEITQVIRDLAKEHKLGLADCHAAYETAKVKNAADWRLLMSDEIHPNMAGHKLLAETLAKAITGKDVSLKDVRPPTPAIPHTLQLLKAGRPIKVLAMPPYDKVIGPALREQDANANVEVTPWPTKGKTLAELEEAAKKVRGMKMDLVILAVPVDAFAPNLESRIHSYSWIMNWSLSFGQQEWDVIAIPPSTAKPNLSLEEQQTDSFARRLIAAQDLTMITRHKGEEEAELPEVVDRWLRDDKKDWLENDIRKALLKWIEGSDEPFRSQIAILKNGKVVWVSDDRFRIGNWFCNTKEMSFSIAGSNRVADMTFYGTFTRNGNDELEAHFTKVRRVTKKSQLKTK